MDSQQPALPEPKRARNFLRFSVIASGAAAVWVVSWLAIAGIVGLSGWSLNLIIPSACVVLFALIVVRQDQTWVLPVRQLTHLIPRIRAGEQPIESIAEVEGGLKELAALVKLLLQDNRQQKSQIAQLESEMRQKVASRTDALERTIGSLRQQATRDALTGLFNRRMLDQYLPDAIDRCRAKKTNLALLMIDVDYFKGLNDTLGHAAGDELLRNIGQIIRSSIRENDAAFRCGGDEFVVVLPGCSEENAAALAARLNSLVTALTRTMHIPQPPSLSTGVATLEQLRSPNAHTLMEEADKRLYEIKSTRAAPMRTAPMAKAS